VSVGSAPAYDVVVIGGGAGGAVVARRLAENTDAQVALIEAGPSDEGVEQILQLRQWQSLLGDIRYGRDFAIVPQPFGNSDVIHSRGVMLGGSTSHNSCIAFIPPDEDFRRWENQGATGWGPESVREYFCRVRERVNIEASDSGNALVRAFIRACRQAGFCQREFPAEVGEGVGWFGLNKRGATRHSSSIAYLHPLSELPRNLTILTETEALRLRLAGGRVEAVETDHGELAVSGEVVLAAGTFASPKLLLLSGVGPAEQLREHGIEVVVDLPAVGEHLQDHPEGVILWEAADPVPEESANFYEAGLFATVDPGATWPDLMFHFGTEAFDLHTAPKGYPTAENAFSITPNVTRARSEGAVRLRSSDPAVPPDIDFRYFTDPEGYDERILVEGIRLARELVKQPALARWVERELAPGPHLNTFDELSRYARETANTVYHPVGTCRMGRPGDRDAVVDPELRVQGLENVRVADASVMPSIVSVNPAITCMMIGEVCAELIGQARSSG
jgi:choline oxidase